MASPYPQPRGEQSPGRSDPKAADPKRPGIARDPADPKAASVAPRIPRDPDGRVFPDWAAI